MSVVADLQATYEQLAARLTELSAGGLSAYTVDGQTVDRAAEMAAIMERMKTLKELMQMEESPFEVVTFGVPG